MADVLGHSALDQWQKEPIRFIEQILRNPETGKPFELLEAERAFLAHAYQTDESGRLVYPERSTRARRSPVRPASRQCIC
jgi:hypothetical protein